MMILLLFGFLYFLPTVIATHRGRGGFGMAMLNLLFGWTGVGWAALMLWALMARPRFYFVPAGPYCHYSWWTR